MGKLIPEFLIFLEFPEFFVFQIPTQGFFKSMHFWARHRLVKDSVNVGQVRFVQSPQSIQGIYFEE